MIKENEIIKRLLLAKKLYLHGCEHAYANDPLIISLEKLLRNFSGDKKVHVKQFIDFVKKRVYQICQKSYS